MEFRNELDLKPYVKNLRFSNTFGLNSIALHFITISNITQLSELSKLAKRYPCVSILGGGSNIILPEVINHLVVRTELFGIKVLKNDSKELIIDISASELWHNIVSNCVFNGWSGLENLALIPGTAGAAPVQNIGAYGVELSDYFHSLQAWNINYGNMVTMYAKDCNFSYRNSIFKQDPPGTWLIISIRLVLSKFWKPVLKHPELKDFFKSSFFLPQSRDIFHAICKIRRSKLPDPAALGNVGSFFKNPLVGNQGKKKLSQKFPDLFFQKQKNGKHKISAGYLIERAGWKGTVHGSVGIHKHQPLILINLGNARVNEVVKLSDLIIDDVKKKFGVSLEVEPAVII